MRDSI